MFPRGPHDYHWNHLLHLADLCDGYRVRRTAVTVSPRIVLYDPRIHTSRYADYFPAHTMTSTTRPRRMEISISDSEQ